MAWWLRMSDLMSFVTLRAIVRSQCVLGGAMYRLAVLVVLVSGLICGCSNGPTPEQFAADDDAVCRSYGIQPVSQLYVECRKSKEQQRQQAKATLAAASRSP